MKTTFELEQQILSCWNITSDIDTLFESVVESDISTDQISNVLLGISQLYELKFDKLFRTFEKLLAEEGHNKYKRETDIDIFTGTNGDWSL